MTAAFRYELRRLATLRVTRRAPGLAVALAAVLGLAAALAVSAGAEPATVALIRLAAALPVLIAALLLGASASGHEHRHAMRTITLAIVPRRFWLALAKTMFTAVLAAVAGAVGALAASLGYALALAWAYAGDRTLIPEGAEAAPVLSGIVPAAAAAAAAGLFGLAVGWLAAWYRTAVVTAAAFVALAVPLAAGWLARLSGVGRLLSDAGAVLRANPVLDPLLNPHVLTAWPPLRSGLHPTPPTSLATTVLLAALALLGVVAGAVKWQRG